MSRPYFMSIAALASVLIAAGCTDRHPDGREKPNARTDAPSQPATPHESRGPNAAGKSGSAKDGSDTFRYKPDPRFFPKTPAK